MNDYSAIDRTLRRVLVVDDEPNARDLLASYLMEGGFDVHTAASAEEALSIARTVRPSLITLDILLKNGSGFGTLYELRSGPETAEIPVVVLSTVNQRKMGIALGASDYLLKPIQKSQLLATAERLISAGKHSPAKEAASSAI
jgi:DNA-binding response OmpR family regulator